MLVAKKCQCLFIFCSWKWQYGFFYRKLKRLNLGGNELTSVPQRALSIFDNLKKLEIQENKIRVIKEGDFEGKLSMYLHTFAIFSPYIKWIDFLSNLSWTTLFRLILGLVRLHETEGLKNLDSLILAHNQLSKVPANVFSHLTLLNSLELEGNQITYVDKDAFAGLEGKFLRNSLNWKKDKFISHPQPIHWKFDSAKCFWVLVTSMRQQKHFNKTNQLKWFKQIFENVKNVERNGERKAQINDRI